MSKEQVESLTEEEKKQRKREKKEKKAARKAAKEASVLASSSVREATLKESHDKKRKAGDSDAEETVSKKSKESKKGKKSKKEKKEKSESKEDSTKESKKPPVASSDVAQFIEENNVSYEPVGAETSFPPVLTFAALDLSEGLREGLKNYTKPTPIQSASFPVTMAGRDVIGIAETGSGKTVAFGVPAIEHILALPSSEKKNVSVLVIAPTRELAMQTHANLTAITSEVPNVKSICIYGGVSKDDQKKTLKKDCPRIVVGTPGRILDLAGEGALKLGRVSWLVLDEADRMLDKGFENDIREIIKNCLPLPRAGADDNETTSRHTCMFSATWPMSVRKLAGDLMYNPVRITVGNDELTANKRVEQKVFVLNESREKERRLLRALNDNGFKARQASAGGKDVEKALVFALYKKEATRVSEFLGRSGYSVACIQGDMTQDRRSKNLEDFKSGAVNILVATDVAARGLDIPKVELVVNQTFPLTIEDYVHRIGRTGRAGRTGKSITFFTQEDKAHAGELMRILKDGNQEIPEGLDQWGTTIKKPTHNAYGAHFRDDIRGTAKKIVFD